MTEAEYNAALDQLEALMARDYLAEAAKITRTTSLADIVRSIQSGDAIATRDIFSNAKYGPLAERLRAAYIAGGQLEAVGLPRTTLRLVQELTRQRGPVEFDTTAQGVTRWVEGAQQNMVSIIAREQGDAVQAIVGYGQSVGDPPAKIARNLLGMPDATGQRVGGVVGLTGQDAQWLVNTRRQLLSGDPATMADYFDRVRRDRRFDGIVRRAMEARRPVDAGDVDRITQRYAYRLLQTRADTVASIHTLEAYNAGRRRLYEQMIEDGLEPDSITKRWKTRGDSKVRDTHRATNGQTVAGSAPFVLSSGALMMNPGDASLGAPLSEIARCRCRAIYSVKD